MRHYQLQLIFACCCMALLFIGFTFCQLEIKSLTQKEAANVKDSIQPRYKFPLIAKGKTFSRPHGK